MNSSKFEIQISNSNTHALCQLPSAKLYFHKEENERCTRQRESQSEYYYFYALVDYLESRRLYDEGTKLLGYDSPVPTYLPRLVLFNFILSLSAFSSTFTNQTPWIELLFFFFPRAAIENSLHNLCFVTIGWFSFWFD